MYLHARFNSRNCIGHAADSFNHHGSLLDEKNDSEKEEPVYENFTVKKRLTDVEYGK